MHIQQYNSCIHKLQRDLTLLIKGGGGARTKRSLQPPIYNHKLNGRDARHTSVLVDIRSHNGARAKMPEGVQWPDPDRSRLPT